MIQLLVETAIAGALAWGSVYLAWWLPLIVLPTVLGIANYQFRPAMAATPHRMMLDFGHMAQQISWIVIAAVICYRHWNAWWGAVLGGVIGYLGCGFMAPRRWESESRAESSAR